MTAATVDGPEPIVGGWHIKMAADGQHCIDVMQMMYNHRVVLSSPDHQFIDHGFCYFGHGVDAHGVARSMPQAFVNAVLAARAWDGVGTPLGYDKQAC